MLHPESGTLPSFAERQSSIRKARKGQRQEQPQRPRRGRIARFPTKLKKAVLYFPRKVRRWFGRARRVVWGDDGIIRRIRRRFFPRRGTTKRRTTDSTGVSGLPGAGMPLRESDRRKTGSLRPSGGSIDLSGPGVGPKLPGPGARTDILEPPVISPVEREGPPSEEQEIEQQPEIVVPSIPSTTPASEATKEEAEGGGAKGKVFGSKILAHLRAKFERSETTHPSPPKRSGKARQSFKKYAHEPRKSVKTAVEGGDEEAEAAPSTLPEELKKSQEIVEEVGEEVAATPEPSEPTELESPQAPTLPEEQEEQPPVAVEESELKPSLPRDSTAEATEEPFVPEREVVKKEPSEFTADSGASESTTATGGDEEAEAAPSTLPEELKRSQETVEEVGVEAAATPQPSEPTEVESPQAPTLPEEQEEQPTGFHCRKS